MAVAESARKTGLVQRLRALPLGALFLPWSALRASRTLQLDTLDSPLPTTFMCRGRNVEVTLPRSAVLWREIALPRKARRRAQAAIAMNLRQTMPAQGRGLHWRAGPVQAESALLRIPVLIAKSDQIAALSAALADRGGRLAKILVEGAPPILFHEDTTFARPGRLWMAAAVVLLCGSVLLQVLSIQWQVRTVSTENAILSVRISEMEAEAVSIRAELDAQGEVAKSLRSDLARFETGRQVLPFLVELSRALPDDVWVSELSGRGTSLILAGFAKDDMTDVVEAISAIERIASVTLNGPVTVDTRTGDQRFEVTVELGRGGS